MSDQNIYQVASEVDRLVQVLEQRPPRTVLEIGMADGGTMREWIKVARLDAILIGIDLTAEPYINVESNQTLHLLVGNSHSEQMLRAVKSILQGKQLDFLFIDGDHSRESVKADFEMYAPLVDKCGGIIALHDIVPSSPDRVGGVPKYWQEIKKDFATKEFVESWQQDGYGIGVMFQ